jgi:hypothetical protein
MVVLLLVLLLEEVSGPSTSRSTSTRTAHSLRTAA